MTSNLPVGHNPSLNGPTVTPSLSTLAKDNPEATPEILAALLLQKEKEDKESRVASWVNEQYVKCKNARNPFERQWYINLAFCAGKQYISPVNVTGSGFRLTVPKAPPWRVRLVVNKIRVAVRTECAKLTTSKPIPTVVPATNENEDFSAAAVGEQILKSKFATAEFEQQYRSWVWWGSVCGTSYLKQYWDGGKPDHDAMQLPDKPELPGLGPLPDEMISLVPGMDEYLKTPRPGQGQICVERVTPFNIFVPDLLCEDINGQPYVIHVMTKSKEWVKEKFPNVKNVSCDTRASATILDAAMIIAKGSEEHLDSVLVKEVWIKPNGHKDFPNGGVVTIINDKVAQMKEEWPYPYPEYPFYKYDGIPTGGFYSDSMIVDLIPVQKEYNKKRSQAIEIQNVMGKPKLLYQKGSVDPRKISSEPGQSIPYTAGYEPPIPMQGVEVPSSFVQEIEKLQQEFDDLSGQHEISRGQTTVSSLTSGTAIAYLQEQDDAKLNYQVASIEKAIETLGKHYLSMAAQYWKDNRLIKTVGKNNSYEAIHWKKNMLRGNTDVKVQTGSALPFSKAAKTALVQELMQNGFLDPSTGMELLQFGGLEKAMDDQFVDKRQAQRENLKMSTMDPNILELALRPQPGFNGEPPQTIEMPGPDGMPQPMQFNGDGTPFQPQSPIPVNSWDNHEEHIHWHNHFRKTQEFELLHPLQKEAFELHVQTHQISIQANIMNQQGMMLQGPGVTGALPYDPNNGQPPQDFSLEQGDDGGSEPIDTGEPQ